MPTTYEYLDPVALSRLKNLTTFQHDAAGLVTFDTRERDQVPPRQGPSHLRVLMECLEKTQAGGESGLAETFHRLAESIKRRALVILLSDFFDDPEKLVPAL